MSRSDGRAQVVLLGGRAADEHRVAAAAAAASRSGSIKREALLAERVLVERHGEAAHRARPVSTGPTSATCGRLLGCRDDGVELLRVGDDDRRRRARARGERVLEQLLALDGLDLAAEGVARS